MATQARSDLHPVPICSYTGFQDRIAPDSTTDVNLTKGDVIKILEQHCPDYVKARGESEIKDIHIDNCGKGNGYMSLVLKIHLQFTREESPAFSVVLKIPLPFAISQMIDDNQKELEPNQKEKEIDENAQTIIDGHNLECEFYSRFQDGLLGYPLPRVYHTQKIVENSKDTKCALILMEDLSIDGSEILGLVNPVTVGQVYSVSRAIACFQFQVESHQEHRDWWMSLENNLHLDAFYSSWLPVGLEAAREIKRFQYLLPRVEAICTSDFGHYTIRRRPKEYGCTTIVQGDVQPFNVFFKRDSNGHMTDELKAIIDYQILLNGNPCFDIARFVCCSVDSDVRKECEDRVYQIYYEELRRLNSEIGRNVSFTYEQGLELYHLALCQQATFITAFLFFLRKMATQNALIERLFPRLIERAGYALEKALHYMNLYNLNTKF